MTAVAACGSIMPGISAGIRRPGMCTRHLTFLLKSGGRACVLAMGEKVVDSFLGSSSSNVMHCSKSKRVVRDGQQLHVKACKSYRNHGKS